MNLHFPEQKRFRRCHDLALMSMTFHFLENSAVGAKKRLEIVSDFYQLTWIDFLKKHSRSTNERPTAEAENLTLGLRLGLDAHKHVLSFWRWDAYLSVEWEKFYEALRMFGTDFQTAFQDPNKSYPRGLRGQLTLAAADLRWRFGLRILSLIMSVNSMRDMMVPYWTWMSKPSMAKVSFK